MPRPRKTASPFRYFNSSPEVIRLVVMMYVHFPLSMRNVEDLLFERGIDVAGTDVRTRAIVIQQKTSRPVQFELTSDVRATLLSWLERRCGSITDYLFPSRIDHAGHMSTRQYARLVDEWVTAIGLRKSEYGTHSLRRTKAAMIYRATGNIRAIQILLGHTKIENTVRYLGVDVEDAMLLAERTEI